MDWDTQTRWTDYFGNFRFLRPTINGLKNGSASGLSNFFTVQRKDLKLCFNPLFLESKRYLDGITAYDHNPSQANFKSLQDEGEKLVRSIKLEYQKAIADPRLKDCFTSRAQSYLLDSMSVLVARNNFQYGPEGLHQNAFAGHEMALITTFLLNRFPERIIPLTPSSRFKLGCGWQKKIEGHPKSDLTPNAQRLVGECNSTPIS